MINSNLNGFKFGFVQGKTPTVLNAFVKTVAIPSGFNYTSAIVCAMIQRSDMNGAWQYSTGEFTPLLVADGYIHIYISNSFWANRAFKLVLVG